VLLSWGWLRRRLFGISPEEVRFDRRGFQGGESQARQRLERIGLAFVHGYHAGLEEVRAETLGARLGAGEAELRGFAFEGAAMALALLDHLTPWKTNRWATFTKGPGAPHLYMMHVGIGWALARLPWRIEPTLKRLDPLLCWLVVDGYGFHEGYFHWRRSVEAQVVPKRVTGYARRVFDQGLGRSLWFVNGADVARIPATIGTFPQSRQADLWGGVGLACAYAGGVGETALQALWQLAGPFRLQLCQGTAFAAKARQRAGNPAAHTELACRALCGMSAQTAATLTDTALEDLPPDGEQPGYEVWRRRLQAHFANSEVVKA